MKFTIRDLFLVTVIVALVLGWILDSLGQRSVSAKWRARCEAIQAFDGTGWELSFEDSRIILQYSDMHTGEKTNWRYGHNDGAAPTTWWGEGFRPNERPLLP